MLPFSLINKYKQPVFYCVSCNVILSYTKNKYVLEWIGTIFQTPIKKTLKTFQGISTHNKNDIFPEVVDNLKNLFSESKVVCDAIDIAAREHITGDIIPQLISLFENLDLSYKSFNFMQINKL